MHVASGSTQIVKVSAIPLTLAFQIHSLYGTALTATKQTIPDPYLNDSIDSGLDTGMTML